LILPDPFNLYSFSISRTLPDDYPLISGGYAERTSAHLQRQLNVAQPVGQNGTQPFCGTCGSVNTQFSPNDVSSQFGHTSGFATALGFDFDNGISYVLDPARVQEFDGFQDVTTSLDASFSLHIPQTVAFPAEVRVFEDEYCVDTQSSPLSFPSHQPNSIFDFSQNIWTHSTPATDSHNTPSNSASAGTAEEPDFPQERHSQETFANSTNGLRQISRHHTIQCHACTERFPTKEGHRRHVSGHHSTVYTCGVSGCQVRAKTERSLIRHHQWAHTPPITLLCGKVMRRRDDQIRRHASECNICTKHDVEKKLEIGVRKVGRPRKSKIF
jgi:hypothetical protein